MGRFAGRNRKKHVALKRTIIKHFAKLRPDLPAGTARIIVWFLPEAGICELPIRDNFRFQDTCKELAVPSKTFACLFWKSQGNNNLPENIRFFSNIAIEEKRTWKSLKKNIDLGKNGHI